VFAGVDTHKDTLAVCLVDQPGRACAQATFANTPAGHAQLAAWLTEHGPTIRVGIEGAANLGAGLARWLHKAGVDVREVPCALTARERRRLRRPGKSDPTDALAIAPTRWPSPASAPATWTCPRSACPARLRTSRRSATTATSCSSCATPKATGSTPTWPSSVPATPRSAGG
jgi:transposase